ncbi:hypothetical protein KM043_017479 [Ampulex compressa]|nr:hypothetical protein KM043_017479 [Ampulex compressa]
MDSRKDENLAESSQQPEAIKTDEKTPGILRSEGAVRNPRSRITSPSLSPNEVEPSSPHPSIDRLSVTFAVAEDETSQEDSRSNGKVQQPEVAATKSDVDMQRISIGDGEEEGDEDDYSASACAIMQKRSSTRRQSRRKRRPSSPFGPEMENTMRRRSSAYTISSGETVISIEEGGNQEQIFERLKLHKEVLSGVKQQPWPLRRKIRLVRQAKSYVRKHEGVLQERLAHTRSTKDAIARISLFMAKQWQYCRRELVNLQTWLIPWELRIKEIESHFGSAVASYFTFLRWLFWINFVMSATLTAFVAIPEVLTADVQLAGERKIMLKEESVKSKHLLTLWEFEGVLKYSPFFYGWYTNQDSGSGYRLPLAYFVTNLVVYIYSFVAILRKMAENSRLSKLTEKEDECAFSWKLFTGWDFMIGNPETAHNRMASIVLGFKEALLEEAEKEKDERNWKIISMRIFVNISVMSLLALSAYAVVKVVGRSKKEIESNWWQQNEITIVMSLITYVFPIFFEILGFLESYHPRKQLRMQLARIMLLNLLNLYSLIFALFNKISTMKHDLYDLKPTNTSCTYKAIVCSEVLSGSQQLATLASLSLVLMNNMTYTQVNNAAIETTLPPRIRSQEDLFLNPILDNDTLEEIYNTGDDPRLDYAYYGDYNISDNGEEYFDILPEGTTIPQEMSENFTDTSWDLSSSFDSNATFESTNNFTTNPSLDSMELSSSPSYDANDTTPIFENVENATEGSTTTSFSLLDITTITESSTTSASFSITTAKNKETPSVQDTTAFISASTEPTGQVIPLTESNFVPMCFEKVCTTVSSENLADSLKRLDPRARKKLRRLCWETMFGQELAKLTAMDLVLTIVFMLGMDFFRAVFIRFMNSCWCWDLEKQFPQYGDFKIAENILHLVYNQGMVWMGMFFSPGLTALNVVKLGILMYLRSWAVLTCNVPHEVIFRASRSNNFYFALLLTMLFLCVLPVGYAIVWVEPSWHCGPFSDYSKIYHLATKRLTDSLPLPIQRCLDYIASPGIVIPLIVLMTLIIYYMASLTGSLREANNDLKIQLRHERTEERRKLFKIVEKRQEVIDTPFTRWKKILPNLPPSRPGRFLISKGDAETANTVEKAVKAEICERKHSSTSDGAEMTDGEQDSLPHDPALFQYVSGKYDKEKVLPASAAIGYARSRRLNILGDSWESQSSECGVIPEIRINEAERTPENNTRANSPENPRFNPESDGAK